MKLTSAKLLGNYVGRDVGVFRVRVWMREWLCGDVDASGRLPRGNYPLTYSAGVCGVPLIRPQ